MHRRMRHLLPQHLRLPPLRQGLAVEAAEDGEGLCGRAGEGVHGGRSEGVRKEQVFFRQQLSGAASQCLERHARHCLEAVVAAVVAALGHEARLQPLHASPGHHHAVVCTVGGRRGEEGYAVCVGKGAQFCLDGAVAGDAPPNDEGAGASLDDCLLRLAAEVRGSGVLECSRQVCHVLLAQLPYRLHLPSDLTLEAGVGEVHALLAALHGDGEGHLAAVACPGRQLQHAASVRRGRALYP
mmetsp:Transcript_17821/g.69084  ORF Transcript_17821/g.69084 Transcript_17821/m.69084 type:complete len:240 (-) Transcript_17821:561-1280(-)